MAGFNFTKLRTRMLSALVMAPLSFAVIWYGGWPFILLLVFCGAVALYEWLNLARKTKDRIFFTIFGLFYVPGSFLCCYLIRADYSAVLAPSFVFMVWSSDTGAYFFGKIIGGPKMAVSISPNKTWAGLAGAVVCPVLVGFLVGAAFYGIRAGVIFAFAGILVGLVGQAGDLLASWLKRRAGAKDSGHIIPGHGGILDRIDSLMLAAPAFLYYFQLAGAGFD